MQRLERKKTLSLGQKLVVVLLISLAFVSIGVSSYLDQLNFETRPRAPRPEEGRTHAFYVHHGTLVYLTQVETLAYRFVPPLCFVFFAAGFILRRRWSAPSSDNRNPGTQH
jgi:hypothetical protein